MKIKAALFWSGGKDSALCLDEIIQSSDYEVACLITSVSPQYHRVSMHGVREELLDRQAAATGIPLRKIYVNDSTNEEYELQFGTVMKELKLENIKHVIFGDIFLKEIRSYREKLLAAHEMTGVFPLWERDTETLFKKFLARGFKAITCCVNSDFLDQSFAGIRLDLFSLKWLPSSVDLCGENGEYHTFVFSGPLFKNDVQFSKGVKVFRPLDIKFRNQDVTTSGFWYIDLIPV